MARESTKGNLDSWSFGSIFEQAFNILFCASHHGGARTHSLHSMQGGKGRRGNQITAPNKRALLSGNFHRPELIESEKNMIPATGVVLSIERLPCFPGRARRYRAQSECGLPFHVAHLPIKLRDGPFCRP